MWTVVIITFRSAGTSFCGQAITDSVLVIAGSGWKDYQILDDGHRSRLQPGIIGGLANSCLAPFGRKIGPDPASINAAMNELREAVSQTCSAGYSNSRTCEIGLSLQSGLYYKSILYLVDE
jgi:FAD/FMN-containing dehydrogenase